MSAIEIKNTLEYFVDRITTLAIQVSSREPSDNDMPLVRIAYSELQDELRSIAASRNFTEEAEYYLYPAVREVIGRLPEAKSDPIRENWLECLNEAKNDLDFYLNGLSEEI